IVQSSESLPHLNYMPLCNISMSAMFITSTTNDKVMLENQRKNRIRFDKIEDTLTIIVRQLKK
ncbi:hypothetical protein, partial [Endozoicomonas sp. SESOKO2]|uniref:hypothetical protein n=1 Tax=Endozoicomonas sp. SESOKO2 TaxID=2828743 RepID=UPI0021495682